MPMVFGEPPSSTENESGMIHTWFSKSTQTHAMPMASKEPPSSTESESGMAQPYMA